MLDSDDRNLMKTAAWMFALHGQSVRSLTLCRALIEDDPHDAVVAAVCANLLLAAGDPHEALVVLRGATFAPNLERAAILLESRALSDLGRRAEAERCWRRYVDKTRGVERTWVSD